MKIDLCIWQTKLLAALLAVQPLLGCVTILQGTEQTVPVIAYPVRASAEIVVRDEDGKEVYRGRSPAQVRLRRSTTYTVHATAPGYQPATTTSDPTTSGAAVAGAFLGMFVLTPIGTVVDLVSGACKSHQEEGIEVTLLREGSAAATVPVLLTVQRGCTSDSAPRNAGEAM